MNDYPINPDFILEEIRKVIREEMAGLHLMVTKPRVIPLPVAMAMVGGGRKISDTTFYKWCRKWGVKTTGTNGRYSREAIDNALYKESQQGLR